MDADVTKYPPPIITTEVEDYQGLYQTIKEKINDSEFSLTLMNKNTVRINPKSSDAYRSITSHKSNWVFIHMKTKILDQLELL